MPWTANWKPTSAPSRSSIAPNNTAFLVSIGHIFQFVPFILFISYHFFTSKIQGIFICMKCFNGKMQFIGYFCMISFNSAHAARPSNTKAIKVLIIFNELCRDNFYIPLFTLSFVAMTRVPPVTTSFLLIPIPTAVHFTKKSNVNR